MYFLTYNREVDTLGGEHSALPVPSQIQVSRRRRAEALLSCCPAFAFAVTNVLQKYFTLTLPMMNGYFTLPNNFRLKIQQICEIKLSLFSMFSSAQLGFHMTEFNEHILHSKMIKKYRMNRMLWDRVVPGLREENGFGWTWYRLQALNQAESKAYISPF